MRRRTLLAATGSAFATWPPTSASSDTIGRGARPVESAASITDSASITAAEADLTRIEIGLLENGDANWTLELWHRLDTEEAETAFQSLQQDVEQDPDTVVQRFATRMDETVAAAAESTQRQMTARDYSVRTETRSVPQAYGLLVYAFVWEGFAAVDGPRLRAGDAIDGFLLNSGTRLTMRWPEGFERRRVEPEPDDSGDRVVVWRGDNTDFIAGEPRLVVSSGADAGPSPVMFVGAGLLGVLGVAGLVVWWRRQSPGAGRIGTGPVPSGDGSGSGGDGESGSADPPPAAGESSPAADTADEPEPTGGDATDDGAPSELLSNEERVLQLLEANGGRMKQQQVVSELGWSEAKTSQVVTSMREDDAVEVFRIGRENVLALPEKSDL